MTVALFGSEGSLVVPGVAGLDGFGALSAAIVPSATLAAPLGSIGELAECETEPYPAPGEFPDWELVFQDGLNPIAYTCSSLPPTDDLLQAKLPLIQARRTGGKLDFNAITDTAIGTFTVYALKRSQAQRIATMIREAVLSWAGTRINGVLIDWTEERVGNQEVRDMDELNRNIEVQMRLDARRQFPPFDS